MESDYSIVFFAACGHYAPSWNWVWKAYRGLSRKYRKNLKRLVRASSIIGLHRCSHLLCSISCILLFSQRVRATCSERRESLTPIIVLFSLAGAIISPKFFRKITYIDNLSELACHVPLTQIDIPPAVYS